MDIVILNENDLPMLQKRFYDIEDLDFSSLENLQKSLDISASQRYYKFSNLLGITFGNINGVPQVFFYGNGHHLSEIFGVERVYG